MRRKIVAGNWKMNTSFDQADDLVDEVLELMKNEKKNKNLMILCPPFTFLELTTDMAEEESVAVGAQNVSQYENGAYTGEISASMLKSMGLEYCIVGHSERRKYFEETEQVLSEKVNKLLEYNIQPIYCCGEVIEERKAEKHFEIVKNQIQKGIFHLSKDEILNIVLAYEPVWAIGTGLTATPEQAQEMHAFIRSLLTEKYGEDISNEISILYGGSCNAKNAKILFANPDVDGGLIGGASLKSEDFYTIYKSF